MSECNKCGITDHEITPKQIIWEKNQIIIF
jgi:hypothetical protein